MELNHPQQYNHPGHFFPLFLTNQVFGWGKKSRENPILNTQVMASMKNVTSLRFSWHTTVTSPCITSTLSINANSRAGKNRNGIYFLWRQLFRWCKKGRIRQINLQVNKKLPSAWDYPHRSTIVLFQINTMRWIWLFLTTKTQNKQIEVLHTNNS